MRQSRRQIWVSKSWRPQDRALVEPLLLLHQRAQLRRSSCHFQVERSSCFNPHAWRPLGLEIAKGRVTLDERKIAGHLGKQRPTRRVHLTTARACSWWRKNHALLQSRRASVKRPAYRLRQKCLCVWSVGASRRAGFKTKPCPMRRPSVSRLTGERRSARGSVLLNPLSRCAP
jgi:hypothetical protein